MNCQVWITLAQLHIFDDKEAETKMIIQGRSLTMGCLSESIWTPKSNPQFSDEQHLEQVFTKVRQKLNRSDEDQILDQRVNVLRWGLFMSITMKETLHLGQNYNDDVIAHRNTNCEELKTLFTITQKLYGSESRFSECVHD